MNIETSNNLSNVYRNYLKEVFLSLIVLTILSFGCKSKLKSKYEFLKIVSTDINKICPILVDSIIKLENTSATPIATFRYNYILKYDTVNFDIHEFEKSLKKTTLNTVKTSPDGKMFRDMYATLEYNYSDTLGNYLFRIIIKPEDYK